MIVVAGIPLLTLATLTIQHALNVTQLLSDLTRKAAGMERYWVPMWVVECGVERDGCISMVKYADAQRALRRAKAEGVREIRQLRRHLRVALDHAEQHHEGCLYCGEGEIVDGDTTPAHRAKCWYYKAARAAQIEADYELPTKEAP